MRYGLLWFFRSNWIGRSYENERSTHEHRSWGICCLSGSRRFNDHYSHKASCLYKCNFTFSPAQSIKTISPGIKIHHRLWTPNPRIILLQPTLSRITNIKNILPSFLVTKQFSCFPCQRIQHPPSIPSPSIPPTAQPSPP